MPSNRLKLNNDKISHIWLYNLSFAVVSPLLSLAMIIGVIFNALKLRKNTINIALTDFQCKWFRFA